MEKKMTFNYFYGTEADQFSFYRIPKALFTDSYFKDLSSDAKILYGLMLDRMSLSIKNQWFDDKNRAYIYFSIEDIMELLNCGRNKAIIIAGILYTVDNIGTFPPVYARCPQSITAIGTLNYACKNIFKSSRIFFPPAARHKPLDSIKFLLRDYPLMSIGYHFPFFGQLRKAFPAFHAGGNPFVACKVSRIYRT